MLRLARLALATGLLLALASCGTSTPSSSPTTPATLTSITISGAVDLAGVGKTDQLSVTGLLSSGSTEAVSASQVAWQSSNTAVATVSASGLVTSGSFGTATITATFQGLTAVTSIGVTITGTWSYTEGGSVLTWVLSQTGPTVTGTFTLFVSKTSETIMGMVSGSMSGTTLTWTMNATVPADAVDCPGVQFTITGTATINAADNALALLIQELTATGASCSTLEQVPPPGANFTMARQ